jgi:hypothetical protein
LALAAAEFRRRQRCGGCSHGDDHSGVVDLSATDGLARAPFHKGITNDFTSAASPESFALDGVTETFDVTRHVNGDKGKPEGKSDDSFNLALLCEKYGISGRLAYNWRSRYRVNGSILYTFMDYDKIGGLPLLPVAQTPKCEWVEGERKLSFVMRANW